MSSYATSSSSKTSSSSGTRQSITKNFEAAFGKLSSSYGFGSSNRASSAPQKPSNASKVSVAPSTTPSLSRTSSSVALSEKEKDMDSASLSDPSSRVFVVDLTRRSSPKAPAPCTSAPKDYEAAFGALSSSYGFAGAVPSLQSSRSTKAPKAPKAPKTQQQTQAPTTTGAPRKDFEAAYGALVSQNGWGSGVAPTTASQGTRFTIA